VKVRKNYSGGITSYMEELEYDALARPVEEKYTTGAETFYVNRTYNATTGFLETIEYPTSIVDGSPFRLKVRLDYSGPELLRVAYANGPAVFWQANVYDARFNVIDESYYNGVRTLRTVDAATGWTRFIQSGPGANNAFQNLEYQYSRNGSLTLRRDINRNLWEQFTYDNANRLDYSTLNGVYEPQRRLFR
jgi:hypothetical protein